ncbi:alpha/beta hydrolase [Arachnia rubra]|uniref:Alpha/beta fold hydrolase n=1 Tax=Arachnia rubra TaxID=1547448 RepID=A0ABX7Y626_9ACTN|nr:alpha/beta hydrolase [Arachnia rubra]QUC08654.1 alpha/beta fold hydrolase [Arachnia rubra]BCR80061.1 alpha/beta hydrolase [Arachnia rubra]
MAALVVGCALLAGPVASALPAYAVPQKSGTNTPAPDEPGAIPKGLESFYSQEVSWYPCGDTGGIQKTDEQGKFSCATVTVPMDYSQPDGKTIQVAVKKRAADGEPRGSLFINPGGPGGSGIGLVEAVGKSFSKDLLAGYDVVGFDPRGVGSSTPITCQDAKPAEEASAEHPQEESSFENWAQGYMDEVSKLEKQCREYSEPGLLDHVGTALVARDLDVLRAVSGEKTLNYLGMSYGTELGYTYAELFPHNTGRLVLDGAMDSTSTNHRLTVETAEGYEKALHRYVQACLEGKAGDNCPLTGSVEDGVQQIRDLITSADASPLKTSDPDVKITGAQLTGAIRRYLSGGAWPQLTAALAPAIGQNDASGFAEAVKQASAGVSMAAWTAVMCQDRPAQGNMDAWKAQYEETQKVAPTFAGGASFDMTCAAWGHYSKTDPIPQDVHAKGAAPILVVGTAGDPATPYHWAQALARQLDSAQLITWDGNAHVAYMRGNKCITTAVDGFLLGGQLPQNNLVCTT